MKAYYFLGRVYSDMQLTGEAINYFKKALNIECEDNATTYSVRARANNQIGQTYMYQKMYKEALPYFYKTYHYAVLAKNNSIIVYALRDIGRSYQAQGQTKKGIVYFEYAALTAKKTRQKYLYKVVVGELAHSYMENRDYTKAKKMLTQSAGLKDIQDLGPYYLDMGDYFYAINQLDSAIYYYKKNLIKSDIYGQQSSSFLLNKIYVKQNDYRQANRYLYKCLISTDSIKTLNLFSNKNLIQSLNKKLQIEKENSRLQKSEMKQQLIIVIIVAILILVLIAGYYYVRNKKKNYEEQQERLRKILAAQKYDSKQIIEANNRRISDLERLLSSSKLYSDEIHNKLMRLERDLLVLKNSSTKVELEQQDLLENKFKQSVVYERFHTPLFEPSIDDFCELGIIIDKTYNNFTSRLRGLYPNIKQQELNLCYLIKLQLQPSEITNLLKCKSSQISMIRKRLYKKFFGEDVKPKVFDDFIHIF
jgi:hypothetical protein